MAGLILPSRFTSQPQVATTLTPEYQKFKPFSVIVPSSWSGRNYDLINNNFLTKGSGSSLVAGPLGLANTSDNSVNFDAGGGYSLLNAGAAATTYAVICVLSTTTTTSNNFYFSYANTGSSYFGLRGAGSNTSIQVTWTEAINFTYTGLPNYADGNPHVFALVSFGPNEKRLYMDGVLVGSTLSNVVQNTTPYQYIGVGGLNRNSHELPIGCGISLLAGFDRAIPESYIRALVGNNVWSMFRAPKRSIWVSGGSSGVSGTLATTNANDISAASGTTTVTGTLARTNANDTSAASGTTTVLGALARTNANDTLAASGSAGSSGSTGTLARTNANDTSAAAGTTTVTGTLAKTNANDSIAASGAVGTVTGTLARTNADDILSASGTAGVATTSQSSSSNGILFPPPINDQIAGQDKQFSLGWKKWINQLFKVVKSVQNVGSSNYQQPLNGFSITFPDNTEILQLDPASALGSGTVTMPSPAVGVPVKIVSTKAVASLTLVSSITINNPATSLVAGVAVSYYYDQTNTAWYRLA